MSLQAADVKKGEKRYTALEKALLAVGAAGLATALIAFAMLAQMFSLFSKIPALDIGYCIAEAEESVKPGPDAVGDGESWNAFEEAEGEVRKALFRELDATLSLLPEGVLDDFRNQGWKIVVTTHDIVAEHATENHAETLAGLTCYGEKTIYLEADPIQLSRTALHEMGHYVDARSGKPSLSKEFKEAFADEREAYRSFSAYGSTKESEMFACVYRDLLMGVHGGEKAAPRCTALVRTAVEGRAACES